MALLPVADALARVLEGAGPTAREPVPLLAAAGRVLAADLPATLTQPPFDTSAMDGYAVRAADVAAPPVTLTRAGESAAGHAYAGTLAPGEAVRISTGAPVPAGADAVVIQENVTASGIAITIREGVDAGANIRLRGFDFRQGDTLLAAGRVLDARAITLAAAGGHGMLPVCRRPVVAILATGDELVEPGTPPGRDQIVGSNAYGLAALVTRAGATPQLLGIARDTPEALAAKIEEAAGADILVTIGGASVGDHDLIGAALSAAGATIDFWKIAMRPGKPMLFGRIGAQQRVLGLPGNPVSCLVTARVFLVPLIARMLGVTAVPQPARAVLAVPLEANGPRQHYMRARTASRDGERPAVSPLTSQDSAALSLMASADCFIVRPAEAPAADAGDIVDVLPLDF
jgi:molybdopterin molybdotransferase